MTAATHLQRTRPGRRPSDGAGPASPPSADALRGRLLPWGDRTRRDLPWRATRDPWAIMVSEAMLQQTQVARVIPRYEAFLTAFPTVEACATAPLSDVIRLWAGLGYNRRAVHLHQAACAIVRRHGGVVPDTLDALRALPGVGPYTARAVLVFSYEKDHGVLDVNAGRVLSRAVAGRSLGAREAQRLADHLASGQRPWDWNQAVLDLGATICTKRRPNCVDCPITDMCRWNCERAGLDGSAAHPDPAEGTAASGSAQGRFEGSDRQARGRLVDALRCGSVPGAAVSVIMGLENDKARADRIATALVVDGLAVWDGRSLSLPSGTDPVPAATVPLGLQS